jgi:hypothetical protein
LFALTAYHWGAKALVGPGERRRLAAHQFTGDAQLLVGVDVCAADVLLARGDQAGGYRRRVHCSSSNFG